MFPHSLVLPGCGGLSGRAVAPQGSCTQPHDKGITVGGGGRKRSNVSRGQDREIVCDPGRILTFQVSLIHKKLFLK